MYSKRGLSPGISPSTALPNPTTQVGTLCYGQTTNQLKELFTFSRQLDITSGVLLALTTYNMQWDYRSVYQKSEIHLTFRRKEVDVILEQKCILYFRIQLRIILLFQHKSIRSFFKPSFCF